MRDETGPPPGTRPSRRLEFSEVVTADSDDAVDIGDFSATNSMLADGASTDDLEVDFLAAVFLAAAFFATVFLAATLVVTFFVTFFVARLVRVVAASSAMVEEFVGGS